MFKKLLLVLFKLIVKQMGGSQSVRSKEQIAEHNAEQHKGIEDLQRKLARTGDVRVDNRGAVVQYQDPEKQMMSVVAKAAMDQVARDDKSLNKRDLARILQLLLQKLQPEDPDAFNMNIEQENTAGRLNYRIRQIIWDPDTAVAPKTAEHGIDSKASVTLVPYE